MHDAIYLYISIFAYISNNYKCMKIQSLLIDTYSSYAFLNILMSNFLISEKYLDTSLSYI